MTFDIRQSQAIHTWPTGAIIDFPQLSLIMLAHDHGKADWGQPNSQNNNENLQTIISDPRLAEAFKVRSFIVPPVDDGLTSARIFGIRFPSAHYCPKCGLMEITTKARGEKLAKRARSYDADMMPFWCAECFNPEKVTGPTLVPMRFVIANENGFLDDFPWDWYVHKACPDERNKGHKLYYRSKGGSASLGDIIITSKNANGAQVGFTDLSEIFDQKIFARNCVVHGNYLQYVKGRLAKPWKGWGEDGTYKKNIVDIPAISEIWDGEELTSEAKAIFPRTMQRGAGNLIFPIVYSSILLPESTYDGKCPVEVYEKINSTITIVKETIDDYAEYDNDDWRDYFLNKVDGRWGKTLQNLGHSVSKLTSYIKSYFGEDSSIRFGNRAEMLRTQEYLAFSGPIISDEHVWFSKRKISGELYNDKLGIQLFESVTLMDKLSAIKVLRGFTRIKPLMTEELIFAQEADNLLPSQNAEFKRIQDARQDPENTDQLPAVEVRGEGVFLKFNYSLLNKWCIEYPDNRLNIINQNLAKANIDFNQATEPLNKRYLFLHTFSHILLKELAEDCGYSLSSLAEIIYCSQDSEIGGDKEMNGILIYTTTSDSEGSLGGLVEKGTPQYLNSIIFRALEKAKWCSSDPLCISATSGQGFLGLNLAACYACVLLPETSCEKMNKYLDRAAIIGTLENKEYGLFNKIL